MILRRLGNKAKIAQDIQKYFPKHDLYIEPFFGAGGMFFNKPKAKYNILNDLDSDVYNLFNVVIDNKEALIEAFKIMPIHVDLWKYWKKNQEAEPIKKALRFLFLSNFGYMGKPDTLHLIQGNSNEILLQNLNNVAKYLFGCKFSNFDFRKLFKKITFRDFTEKEKSFIYADPPYLDTGNNYFEGFKEQDVIDLLDTLISTNCKFAYSEFDHPFIIEQAKSRGLIIYTIGERKTMKNRRTEILIANYMQELTLF